MQKFKMAAKMKGKRFLGKVRVDTADTLWVKNFVEITPSHIVSEKNACLHFSRNSIWPPQMEGKPFFWKSHQ